MASHSAEAQCVNRLENYRYKLDRNSVLNFMGYSDPEKARKPVLKITDEQIARAHEFAEPWAAAIEVPLCGIENDKIHLKYGVEQLVLHSEQLPKILRHAESVVILLASAGNAATLESKRLMDEGKLGQALAMDAVGSAMVVEAMKALTDQVSAVMARRCVLVLAIPVGISAIRLFCFAFLKGWRDCPSP